jgi:outer membrane protein insertion porin family
LALFLFAAAPTLLAQVPVGGPPRVPLVVGQITITNVGPKNVSDSLVLANIRVKPGEAYSRNAIDNDVRTLYATGYFDNIQVREERVGNTVHLVYALEGKLKLTDLTFSGNKKYSVNKLRKQVTSKIGEPLDYRKLFNDTEAIKKLYVKAGLAETKVKYVVSPDERNGVGTVTFEIIEAPKLRVVDVHFEGAQAFKQSKLRKVVKTRRWWWLSWLTGSGKLKSAQVEEDEDKLIEFYQKAGYIDFDLKGVQVTNLTPTRVEVTFQVSEGRPYKVGAIGIAGATVISSNEILSKLKMGVSNTFSPQGLAKDVETVQDLYGAKGYIDARVMPQKRPNTDTGTMDLVLGLEEGNQSKIEKIEIKGNTKTKDKVIRRELSVAPGEVFNMVNVKKSKLRLEGLNYFERVETQAEPTDVKDSKNLVIAVTEKNTGSFMVGAGFSTIDSLVGFVELNQGNFDLFNPPWFTGGGQKLRLRVAIGTERQDYVLTFIEPWFLGRKLTLNTELYYRDLQYVSLNDLYQERIAGVRVGLTKALGSDFLIGGVNYTYENVSLDLNSGYAPDQYGVPLPGGGTVDIPGNISREIYESAGDYRISRFGTFLSYDTRGGGFLPNKGQRTELRGDVSSSALGGNVDTYRLEARTSWYFPGFAKGHVLELGGRIGVIDYYGESDSVPLFQRLFLGGLDTLRGFKFRDVGPKDRFGEPLGGGTYWFATAEYSIPVIERVRLALFYDAGMVYPEAYSFTPQRTYQSLNNPPRWFTTGTYNDNWGIGIRLNLPIGPLRLDYGIPIKSDRENDSSGRFQFSAGYTRDF